MALSSSPVRREMAKPKVFQHPDTFTILRTTLVYVSLPRLCYHRCLIAPISFILRAAVEAFFYTGGTAAAAGFNDICAANATVAPLAPSIKRASESQKAEVATARCYVAVFVQYHFHPVLVGHAGVEEFRVMNHLGKQRVHFTLMTLFIRSGL